MTLSLKKRTKSIKRTWFPFLCCCFGRERAGFEHANSARPDGLRFHGAFLRIPATFHRRSRGRWRRKKEVDAERRNRCPLIKLIHHARDVLPHAPKVLDNFLAIRNDATGRIREEERDGSSRRVCCESALRFEETEELGVRVFPFAFVCQEFRHHIHNLGKGAAVEPLEFAGEGRRRVLPPRRGGGTGFCRAPQ